MLAEMADSGERAARGRPSNSDSVSRLSDIGVSAKQSERWQKLAAIPEARFEQAVAAARGKRLRNFPSSREVSIVA